MKLLPNINKSVPEAADPALIKPVSDAIEAVDQAIGAKPSTLTTTAKTIVPAINELQAKSSLLEPAPGHVQGDIKAFAEAQPYRIKVFTTSEATTDIPVGFNYASGIVLYRNGLPFIFLISHQGKIATRVKSGGAWGDWTVLG